MSFQLEDINRMAYSDPAGLLALGEERYEGQLRTAAELIALNLGRSPIVLLAGPSGSGKTTSSLRLGEELLRRGIKTHTISLDDYFRTVNPLTSPRTETGEYDYESPRCLDMELLNEHFTALSRHQPILVPHYSFLRQMRDTSRCRELRLGPDEIAVFEGIHALNDSLSRPHPEAFRVYLSARSNVLDGEAVAFKGTWMRLVRRSVRDLRFRGSEISMTLSMWDNIRRGEKLYISPFKDSADFRFDSALPGEVGVLRHYAAAILSAIPGDSVRRGEMLDMVKALERFVPIDPALVPGRSVLREFIGDGQYQAH